MKPVAYIDHSGHPRHLSYLQGAKERELYGPLRPLYEQPDAAAWWSLVMGAAASIEDAANCLRDPAAKKQAEGAAKHYREAAQKLWDTPGVPTPGLTQQLTIPVDWMCASQAEHQGDCTKWCGQARCLRAPAGVEDKRNG